MTDALGRGAFGLLAAALAGTALAADAPISAPSQYSGYAIASYDGYQRSSLYVPMRDGTRIAVDVFRPTRKGALATEKLPVVWMNTPYNRRTYNGAPTVERYPGYAIQLAKYGYIIAIADFRGVYASFGKNLGYNRGEWREPARMDAYDLTEWFAHQDYSNGKIGMWGCSATGGSQMQAATTRPPSLKAIMPMSAEFDAYAAFVVGGIPTGPRIGPPDAAGGAVAARDKTAVAVDGADGAALLAQAVASHAGNTDSPGSAPFRDSTAESGDKWWELTSPASHLAELKQSAFGVYSAANWEEAGTRHGPFLTFNNLPKGHTKLVVGPSTHCNWSAVKDETGFDITTEELRFFDYWLKGVRNQVMEEPAVTYYTYNAPKERQWRQSNTWPLANEVRTKFYFGDGVLGEAKAAAGQDATATGAPTPATSILATYTPGGVSYLSRPLPKDVEVTGYPVVDLWLSTKAADVDVTAWLRDVAPDGTARTYQMFGRLRASSRKLSKAPYNNLGLPWHSHLIADDQPIPADKPVRLTFDMLPMSYLFKAGHRVRLTVGFADPQHPGAVTPVTVYHDPNRQSVITLPIIPAAKG